MSNATTNAVPTTAVSAQGAQMQALMEQIKAAKKEMAQFTAKEVKVSLDAAFKQAESSTAYELPTPSSPYLTAKMCSAQFMALRDELVSAYARNEAVQQDRVVLNQRMSENSFRSDVERAGAERSLAYYESLEQRVNEILSLLADTIHLHGEAVKEQHADDVARQQDVPEADRVYTAVPALRWVSKADRDIHGDKADDLNDLARLAQQAEFWLDYNTK